MERHTRQRQAVLDSLSASGRTLSPPEILEIARQHAPGLNLSTVYRQVKALESDGQLVKVELPGQPARFEARCRHGAGGDESCSSRSAVGAAALPHHHHHFHCVVCNAVVPIHGCPGAMQELAPRGYLVESHDLVLHGRCAQCAQEPAR
ncbi:Fur family transcriptional regulator [Piscinibacter sakaiensis]|uniref:Fur family transcriptional regulator n=1 Tax=Piscinibacter sakaiensis TaxID=1547922 RepID=UPI003AACC1B1